MTITLEYEIPRQDYLNFNLIHLEHSKIAKTVLSFSDKSKDIVINRQKEKIKRLEEKVKKLERANSILVDRLAQSATSIEEEFKDSDLTF